MRKNLIKAWLFLAVATGCRDTAVRQNQPTEPPASAVESVESRSTTPPAAIQAKPAHESAIRFSELPLASFPEVIATNGEPKGLSTILESLGSGAAAIDFDLDGWEDCLIAGGGDFDNGECVARPMFLLRNQRGRFVRCDKTAISDQAKHYNHGLATTDFDNDGFTDVLLTGFGGIQLFRNLGDGTFASGELMGLHNPSWSASCAWADFNGDSFPDLYVVNYVDWSFENDPPCFAADGTTRDNCSPKLFNALPDALFLNNGDETFTDATQDFGVRPDGKGLGVVAADIDLDGLVDLYVGNDVMINFLYRNTGTKFEDLSSQSGACVSRRGTPDASMGLDVADFNADGLPDLWAANFELENFALYRNQGQMQFRHSSDVVGVSAIGSTYVGWGSVLADLDLDSDPDVTVCNGHVVKFPEHSTVLQSMIVLENINSDYFEEVTTQAGKATAMPRNGRGLAVTDHNHDGKLDLIITPVNSPSALLANQTKTNGQWISIRLVGTTSPRIPVGASMTVKTSSGQTLLRQQKSGGSYASSATSNLLIGLPKDQTVLSVTIQWPGGLEQSVSFPSTNSRYAVVQKPGHDLTAVLLPE